MLLETTDTLTYKMCTRYRCSLQKELNQSDTFESTSAMPLLHNKTVLFSCPLQQNGPVFVLQPVSVLCTPYNQYPRNTVLAATIDW